MKRSKYDFPGRWFDAFVEWLSALIEKHCPEGWEDEKGFHHGKKPEKTN